MTIMFPIILLVLLSIAMSAVTPLILSRQRYRVTWWDYVFPFLGILFWFILRACDVGDDVSMINFIIEMTLILLVSAITPWLRFALRYAKTRLVSTFSFFLTFLPIGVAICLRLTLPLLPE